MKKLFYLVNISVILLSCACFSSFPANVEEYIQTGYHISNFQWHENQLYFGAGYCLYHLDPETQIQQTIRCAENQDRIFGRPIVDGRRIILHVRVVDAVTTDFYRYLEALDKNTGDTIWRYNDDWEIRDYFLFTDDLIYTAGERSLSSIDANSGQLVWQKATGYFSSSTPFVIHNNLLWYTFHDNIYDDPQGRLYLSDLRTGETLQTIDLLPEVNFEGIRHVDEEWIVGLVRIKKSERLIGINQMAPNHIAWQITAPRPFGVIQFNRHGNLLIVNGGNSVQALDITTGDQLWQLWFSSRIKVDPEAQSETVIPIKSFFDNRGLYGIDVETGSVVWKHPSAQASNNPLVIDDVVYTGYNKLIDAIDLQSGELLWRVDIDSQYEYYDPPAGW